MFAPQREAFGCSLQSPQRNDSAGRRDIRLSPSAAAFSLCRLLGCWTVGACAGVRCGLQGACGVHCNRTWTLLDTVRINVPCGKWRRISCHSPPVPSFQSHQACTQQCNTARPPAQKHTAASDCHPVHVAAASFHCLLSCTPPQTFPCRTFLFFLNFYSGIFLDGDAVRSFSSVL